MLDLRINHTALGEMLFVPTDPKRVTMYVCGPTVYSEPHLGNARPAVVFDVLFRVLRGLYGQDAVFYASNMTDIDDKIIDRAHALGISIQELTDSTIAAYQQRMDDLGVLRPTFTPRATESIPQMIDMISRLIAKDNAYEIDGHVFFSVATATEHGSLSGQKTGDGIAAVRGTKSMDLKRDHADFVMWKPSTSEQPGWESPWGKGRPGWHIECSAMIAAVLGDTIDIHGGGLDLIFPHHECEIAQSTSLTGKPLARHWVHNGMVTVDGRKMSKSSDNFITISDILAETKPEVLRYFLLSGHYSQPIDFTWGRLTEAKLSLDRLFRAMERLRDVIPSGGQDVVQASLAMNLNTPEAIATLHVLAKEATKATDPIVLSRLKAEMIAGGQLLGVLREDPERWFGIVHDEEQQQRVSSLVARRAAARHAKNWPEADSIRTELESLGVLVEDGVAETKYRAT